MGDRAFRSFFEEFADGVKGFAGRHPGHAAAADELVLSLELDSDMRRLYPAGSDELNPVLGQAFTRFFVALLAAPDDGPRGDGPPG